MPLDSSGGGGLAGVEYINGKDGVLNIMAGSNVTIDNSKSDTIVINASGGGGGSLVLDSYYKDVIMIDESNPDTTVLYGFNLSNSDININENEDRYVNIPYTSGLLMSVDSSGNLFMMKEGVTFISGIDVTLQGGNSLAIGADLVDIATDSLRMSHNIALKGNTTVDIGDHSYVSRGVNHSMVVNSPFDALSIGNAIMDGFRAQQYDSIYTMNGLMKAQGFFGDTTRYPVMFMSLGMPMSANFKAVMFKPEFDNNGFRFLYNLFDSEGTMLNYVMGTEGIVILDNGTPMLSLGVDGIVKASAYIEDKTANSYAQMQDLARTRIDDPTDGYLVNPSTRDVVVIIKTDSTDLTLPDIADCEFWNLYVINKSTTTTTLRTVSNESVFWDGTTVTGSHDCVGGAITHVIFDGENYSTK